MKPDTNTKYILGLSLIPCFGYRRINLLYKQYEDWEKIWRLSYGEIENILGEKLAKIFIKNRNIINLDEEIIKYEKLDIDIITCFDKIYPKILKEIYSPPVILYARGNIEMLKNKNLLSVVGTRKYSEYGKSVIKNLVTQISNQGITIVSGLAIGIDALAHIEALKESGSTIAILGSAIDRVYPSSNFNLAKKIQENGLILSELPIGTKFSKENFPKRNRIIAGLSRATLIIEAGEKSGALITANFAINENRDVLAIPGSIFNKNSMGTNNLIKQGAKIITSIDDILEIYQMTSENQSTISKKDIIFDSFEESTIYEILSSGPLSIDKIVISSRLNVNVVIASLTKMELSNLIENIGNQNYRISN